MDLVSLAQAYCIVGALFGLAVNLANGTVPRPVQMALFILGWPYFFYRGFVRGR